MAHISSDGTFIRTRSTWGAALLTVMLGSAAGLAVAQTAPPVPGSPTAGHPDASVTRDIRASKLIGKEVRNPQNQKLGEIRDLILDVNNEVIHYAILSFGGAMGVGDKLFAFPLTAFQYNGTQEHLVLDINKEKLRSAPGFEKSRWPDWAQPDYAMEIERYFGAAGQVAPHPNSRLVRVGDLLGRDVDDQNAKDAGEIEDVVVSLRSARVRYVVVSFDRAWSLNDKLLALPLKAIRVPDDKKADLVLTLTRNDLDAQQAFDRKQWPDLNEPVYRSHVDRWLEQVRRQ
ncbi:PRC-barrel domain-containing protein [Roseateles sp. YR242]|uniref:PRC-barrel domain-containing protein n=1 Tax=Roseateles sp. YR242 TaxID=1855305 RepID=UPI0008AC5394|nr:PRC-barrel domain-containing protein [Roseateles sp. YR242]SEL18853.1 PRC-barrel domain-containing protein [Roseateles sp. YR242]